jgi:outer membrane biosynthesis protein TonB
VNERIAMQRIRVWIGVVACLSLGLAACTVPQPYRVPPPPSTTPQPTPSQGGQPPPETRPEERPPPVEQSEPVPPPVREPTLGPASKALVGQAQTQLATKNYAVAASSIERAMRIEPDNPLLWIELGKVRLAEGNFVQAENMGLKAVSMTVNAPRAQSSAWRLIADSFRARGKNVEARDAQARAEALAPR